MILSEIFHLENVELCYFGKLALDKRQLLYFHPDGTRDEALALA